MDEMEPIPTFMRRIHEPSPVPLSMGAEPIEHTLPEDSSIPVERLDREATPRGDEPSHSFTKYEASKIAWKQQIEGNVLTLRLHFDQDVSAIANLALGKRVLIAIAEIK